MNLKTKSILLYDYGTFTAVAERLSRDFGRVMYYSPWKSSFPQAKFTSIGDGFDNVERINDFFDYVDEADVICFTDVGDGDIQLQLEAMGKNIWGSRKGEQLEFDRIGFRELLKDIGWPVAKYEVVKGMTDLRKYLKSHKNVWVKTNIFRGDFETFKSINYDYIETRLNEIDQSLGLMKEKLVFICEVDMPDKVELAYDGYTIDGNFPTKSLCGIEVKDLGYVGSCKEYKDLPKPVKDFNIKIAPVLKNYRYKNFFHPEMRIGKDGIGYVIDPCARFGSPPNECYQELFSNFSEIIWEGAHGNCIDPKPVNKYAVETIIHCNWAERNWLPVLCPDKYKHNIKFRNVTIQDGIYYIVPQYLGQPEIGAIVSIGDNIEGCVEEINHIAEQLKGFYIEIPSESFDKAQQEIDKFKSFGYDLFD